MKKFGLVVLLSMGSIAVYEFLKQNGMLDQVCGKTKRVAGDVLDDPQLRAEGTVQSGLGKTKEVFHDLKEDFTSYFD